MGTDFLIAMYIKFNHTKHDMEQFTYNLKVLGKMIGLSNKQVLEHFKEALPPKIEAQLQLEVLTWKENVW